MAQRGHGSQMSFSYMHLPTREGSGGAVSVRQRVGTSSSGGLGTILPRLRTRMLNAPPSWRAGTMLVIPAFLIARAAAKLSVVPLTAGLQLLLTLPLLWLQQL